MGQLMQHGWWSGPHDIPIPPPWQTQVNSTAKSCNQEEGGLYCRSATRPHNNTTRLRTKREKKQCPVAVVALPPAQSAPTAHEEEGGLYCRGHPLLQRKTRQESPPPVCSAKYRENITRNVQVVGKAVCAKAGPKAGRGHRGCLGELEHKAGCGVGAGGGGGGGVGFGVGAGGGGGGPGGGTPNHEDI